MSDPIFSCVIQCRKQRGSLYIYGNLLERGFLFFLSGVRSWNDESTGGVCDYVLSVEITAHAKEYL